MKVSRFPIFGLSPIDYSKDFTKAFFLGLPNPQNCFVFCFKVDLDLAEIQNHVLLKNAGRFEKCVVLKKRYEVEHLKEESRR